MAGAPPDSASGEATEPGEGLLVRAQQILLKEPRGHIFGPLDLEIPQGGVTVLAAPNSTARTALLLALCGRMHLSGGKLTVLGHSHPRAIFRNSAIVLLNEIDQVPPAVTVRDVLTEQLRWNAHWYKWVPRAGEEELERLCSPVFGDIALPPLDTFVEHLPAVQRFLLQISLVNSRKPALLVVGRIDATAGDMDQAAVLERLVELGRNQSIITADVNRLGHLDAHVIDMSQVSGWPDAAFLKEASQ